MNCPICLASMEEKRVGEADFYLCRDCRGLWVGMDVLAKLSAALRQSDFTLKREMFSDASASVPMEVILNCPVCGQAMLHSEYAFDSGIMIDRCGSCRTVWLDVEKIFLIQQYLRQSVPEPGEAAGLLGKPWEPSIFDDSSVAGVGAEILLEGFIALLAGLLD